MFEHFTAHLITKKSQSDIFLGLAHFHSVKPAAFSSRVYPGGLNLFLWLKIHAFTVKPIYSDSSGRRILESNEHE
jgi:hypothetical protein